MFGSGVTQKQATETERNPETKECVVGEKREFYFLSRLINAFPRCFQPENYSQRKAVRMRDYNLFRLYVERG